MIDIKTRPILFNGEMVRAILDGRKSQTRRVIKPQPETSKVAQSTRGFWYWPHDAPYSPTYIKCLYDSPGHHLWVRETWQDLRPHQDRYVYRADPGDIVTKWRPSIHMPKVACRLWLEVTRVRVEQLQDISEDDAKSEGVPLVAVDSKGNIWDAKAIGRGGSYTDAFYLLWNTINAKRGYPWDSNPWVWVIEFEVLD